MTTNIIKFILAPLALIFLVPPISLAETFKIENPFIQLGLGKVIAESNDSGSLKLAAGLDFSEHIGAEIASSLFTDIFISDVNAVFAAVVGKYPLSERWMVSGKVGVVNYTSKTTGFLFTTAKETKGTNALLGIDLKFDISKYFALVLSAESYGKIDIGGSNGKENLFPITGSLRLTF